MPFFSVIQVNVIAQIKVRFAVVHKGHDSELKPLLGFKVHTIGQDALIVCAILELDTGIFQLLLLQQRLAHLQSFVKQSKHLLGRILVDAKWLNARSAECEILVLVILLHEPELCVTQVNFIILVFFSLCLHLIFFFHFSTFNWDCCQKVTVFFSQKFLSFIHLSPHPPFSQMLPLFFTRLLLFFISGRALKVASLSDGPTMDLFKASQTVFSISKTEYILVTNINIPPVFFNKPNLIQLLVDFVKREYLADFERAVFELSAAYTLKHDTSGHTRTWVGSFSPKQAFALTPILLFERAFEETLLPFLDAAYASQTCGNLVGESVWKFDSLISLIVNVQAPVSIHHLTVARRGLANNDGRRSWRRVKDIDLS